jgi:hypothetical protein
MTPPTSPTPVLIPHVTSKKSSRYLNWKKTAQKKEARCPGQPSEPFSAVWTAQHLYQDKPESALAALSIWTHRKRSKEVSHETIVELNALSDDNVILALNELKEPKKYIRGTGGQQLSLKTQIRTLDDRRTFAVTALVDSGSTGSCIDSDFVKARNIATKKVACPIPIYGADGTPSASGIVTEYVEMEMQINDHKERITLAITGLGKEDIFLGHEWLQYHNPSIDWKRKHLYFDRCLRHCNARLYDNIVEPEDELEPEPVDGEEIIDEGERLLMIDMSKAMDICAHYTPSQEMAVEEERKKKREKTVEEDLPAYLQDYRDVFDKKEFDELPPSRPWDHAIELIEGADTTFKCQLYGLSHEERAQLDEFLKENLRTGRIRVSNSPMASPFFFVKKKDGRLHPVQDYRRLNDITKKNRYPPPLISDLINALQDAKYFTKLDVHWGYNNVRIKEGDEWKAAF